MANVGRGLSGAASGAAAGNALLPGVGGIVGGVLGGLGGLFGGGGESPEEAAARKVQEAYGELQIATPEQRRVQLEYLKSVGQLTPEMEQEIAQQDTEMKNISIDPRFKAQQMAALQRISQQGREGLTLEDRSALADVQRQEAQANRGQQEAIMQNMAARGQGGAGAELAARLQASQSSADRAGSQGLNIAAQAQQRALQAMMTSGNMAGQMQQQEFGQQAQTNQAQDAINRFNTGNRQQVQTANVGARNIAQQSNLRDAQNIEANRVGTINAQRQGDVNANLGYMDAKNQQTLGKAGAGMQVAQAQQAGDKREDEGFAGTMAGLGAVASNLGGEGGPLSKLSSLWSSEAPKMSESELVANAGQGPLKQENYVAPKKQNWGF